MGIEFLKRFSIQESIGTTGTSAAVNGPVIDFSAWEGAVGLAHFNTTNASGYIKFQEGTASGSVSDVSGFAPRAFKTVALEVYRPNKQFGRFVTRGVSTTGAYTALHTILYGARTLPSTHAASTTTVIKYSPTGGSATD